MKISLLIILSGFLILSQAARVFSQNSKPEAKIRDCNFDQSFVDANTDSHAIFLGRAVEERSVPMTTKGGTSIGYTEVRFEVARSWRLIDKKSVWLRLVETRMDGCGYQSLGSEYLVYASRLNDTLYISPKSRTMAADLAGNDLQNLGANELKLSRGEFKAYYYTIVYSLFGFVFLILLALSVYFIVKRYQ